MMKGWVPKPKSDEEAETGCSELEEKRILGSVVGSIVDEDEPFMSVLALVCVAGENWEKAARRRVRFWPFGGVTGLGRESRDSSDGTPVSPASRRTCSARLRPVRKTFSATI